MQVRVKTLSRSLSLVTIFLVWAVTTACSVAKIPAAADLNPIIMHRPDEAFLIHGWRWHTYSLLYETRRLCEGDSDADYVIGFNMRGLHHVQREVFYPWLASNLPSCKSLVEALQEDQKAMSVLGDRVLRLAAECRQEGEQQELISSEAARIHAIGCRVWELQHKELIPAIARHISARDQRALSTKVLRSLGVLDSRLHLVGMHEAIKDHPEELEMFRRQIPAFARGLLPRWKRLLYDVRGQ